MQYNVENSDYAVEFTAVNMDVAVTGQAEIEAVIGNAAQIDVGEAINYIKTGTSEIEAVVTEKTAAFNLNAEQKTTAFNANAASKTATFDNNASNKTNAFNQNATDKTNAYNSNATDKTTDFDNNASAKTNAYNDNATAKLSDFDANTTNKTNAFNQNATDKTTAFNLNATNKTTDFNNNASAKTTAFNDNYTEKKGLIDAEVANAAASATAADNSAKEAKQWAIGDPSEPSGNSAKYWAEEAATTLANKQDLLVSGTNIKTINNESLLGSGNISISGGASYTAGTGIDITSDVISVDSTVVTTNTDQDITGIKTFVGEKRIKFKQSASGNKLGFTLYDNDNKEAAAFEYRPNAINSYPLMYLGQYKGSSSVSYVDKPTYVGFRYYDSYNQASYNLVAPLAKDARSSFSLDVNYKTFYLPLGVTDGNTTVTTGSNGVLDISSLLSGGGSYTAGTGIDITKDVISVTSPTLINNGASDDDLAIGKNSRITRSQHAVAVGYGAEVSSGSPSVAIGYNAKVTGLTSIQLGEGTNSDSATFYVGINHNNFKMLDWNGIIPDARISSNIARTANVVKLNTAQTITGTKTFAGDGWVTKFKNNYVYYNVVPSETVYTAIAFVDSNNEAMGTVECMRATDNATIMEFGVRGANGSWGSQALQLRIDANGNSYAYAPTPAAGSNDTNIATTGWVHTEASNLAMPNYATRIALTLPASGGTIQAPYDGYIVIVIDAQAGSYLSIGSNYYQAGPSSGYIGGMLPIRKGDHAYVFYSNLLNVIQCEFYPCVGSL